MPQLPAQLFGPVRKAGQHVVGVQMCNMDMGTWPMARDCQAETNGADHTVTNGRSSEEEVKVNKCSIYIFGVQSTYWRQCWSAGVQSTYK